MSRRLIIVDRSLADERGHHHTLTRLITNGALAAEHSVIWLTHQRFSSHLGPDGVTVYPVFSTSLYESFGAAPPRNLLERLSRGVFQRASQILTRLIRSLRARIGANEEASPGKSKIGVLSGELGDEWLDALFDIELDSEDDVLVHSADGDIYRAALDILVAWPTEHRPRLHLVTPWDASTMPHYERGVTVDRVIEYFRVLGFLGHKVFLYAETESLANEFSTRWSVPVAPLEVPAPTPPLAERTRNLDSLTVTYLGAARTEKGFDWLPEVVAHFASSESNVNIQFRIQCSPPIAGFEPEITQAVRLLRAQPENLVTLLEETLSLDGYYQELERSDVMVLCYDREKYRIRGSGIATEAVAFGNTVIATSETSPAHIAGDAAVVVAGPDEVIDAIQAIADDPAPFKRRAAARQQDYLARHESRRYVEKLTSGIEIEAVVDTIDAPVDVYSPVGGSEVNWRFELAGLIDGDLGGRGFVAPRLLERTTARNFAEEHTG